jgi:hypothetical protein
MLPVLLVLAACSGENTTAPEGNPAENTAEPQPSRGLTPVMLLVSPGNLTIETNQLIQFRAHGRTDAGDSVGAAVTWRASGGTILPDGRFSAAAIGTFTVIARSRVRGDQHEDTTLVHVVRRQAKLASLTVTPDSASLTPGLTQKFTAIGRLKGGTKVSIGVVWSSTGGSVDPDGTYLAGDTAGTYRVVASNTAGTLSDTATVTISAPPSPPPPPPPPPADSTQPEPTPPPAPVVEQVTLIPASVTLAPSVSKQFSAYGRTTTGDSVSVPVTFTATGGTITASGLFTAGSSYGTFRVVAKSGILADTSAVTITVPLGSTAPTGIPFGPFGAWNGLTFNANTEVFTLTHQGYSPDNIVDRLSIARQRGVKQLPAMTGGARANYLTDGVFDMAKWKARMDQYNTPAIKAAVAAAVSDGTLMGNSVMDEPGNTGINEANEANSWGPAGTMTKARVDSMCGYVKAIFPTLAVGVFHDYKGFEPTKSYQVCDFIVSQYRMAKGDVTAYRDGGLALAQRDGHAILFSLNIIDGGAKDSVNDGVWDCPLSITGGYGSYAPNCRMTAQQVRDFGMVLGPAGCGLVMWHYDDVFMADPDNQAAFRDVAQRLGSLPAKACRRQ